MPFVTDDKIDDMDEPDFEGPPTLSDVTAAFDGIYHGLQKYDYVSFPWPIGRFPSSQNIWYHEHSDTGMTSYPYYRTCWMKPWTKSSSENNVPNGLKQMLSTYKL